MSVSELPSEVMVVYCGKDREIEVEVEVIDIGCGAGQIPCLECNGSGTWPFMPRGVKEVCVQCKGTGKQLIAI